MDAPRSPTVGGLSSLSAVADCDSSHGIKLKDSSMVNNTKECKYYSGRLGRIAGSSIAMIAVLSSLFVERKFRGTTFRPARHDRSTR